MALVIKSFPTHIIFKFVLKFQSSRRCINIKLANFFHSSRFVMVINREIEEYLVQKNHDLNHISKKNTVKGYGKFVMHFFSKARWTALYIRNRSGWATYEYIFYWEHARYSWHDLGWCAARGPVIQNISGILHCTGGITQPFEVGTLQGAHRCHFIKGLQVRPQICWSQIFNFRTKNLKARVGYSLDQLFFCFVVVIFVHHFVLFLFV